MANSERKQIIREAVIARLQSQSLSISAIGEKWIVNRLAEIFQTDTDTLKPAETRRVAKQYGAVVKLTRVPKNQRQNRLLDKLKLQLVEQGCSLEQLARVKIWVSYGIPFAWVSYGMPFATEFDLIFDILFRKAKTKTPLSKTPNWKKRGF